MIKQFLVVIQYGANPERRFVNTSNAFSAWCIAKGIWGECVRLVMEV